LPPADGLTSSRIGHPAKTFRTTWNLRNAQVKRNRV